MRLFGKGRKRKKEPDYMKTGRYDGRRSVDREKFLNDERVKEHILRLAKQQEKRDRHRR